MRRVFQDIQHFFAERRVARGRPARWWHPPAFRLLVADIAQNQGQSSAIQGQALQGAWVPAVLIGSTTLLIGLAGYGVYVLRDIATR